MIVKLKNIFSLFIIFSVLFTFLFFPKYEVNAEESEEELIHLVVLADISGSLKTEDTEALQFLTKRIPRFLDTVSLEQSKFSVVAFASEAIKICDTKTIKEYKGNTGSNELSDCLEKIQSSRSDNPNRDKRAKGVGIDTNQVKAFETALEIVSLDDEKYIPVFLLLTDGALDPIDTGSQSEEASSEYTRGNEEIKPLLKKEKVQLFIFGFGNVTLSDLTQWETFSAPRRACQTDAPERTYLNEGNPDVLLLNINTAMEQVTCGEGAQVVTLRPGQPSEYYVSDLTELLFIKIDIGSEDVSIIVKDPEGGILTSANEINNSDECKDIYVICYKVENPSSGDWILESESSSSRVILATLNQEGSFFIRTDCTETVEDDGIENCTFTLLPTREDSSDLNKAFSSLTFNFRISGQNIEEIGSFYEETLSIQLFRNISLGAGVYEVLINPISSEFNLNDDFRWLKFNETIPYTINLDPEVPIIVEPEEPKEREPFQFSLWMVILPAVLLLAYYLLSQRKRNLPEGTISYGLKNRDNLTNKYDIYGGNKNEIMSINTSDDSFSVENGNNESVNQLILHSDERYGLKVWDQRSAKAFKFEFEDNQELGVEGIEIIIYDKYKVIFEPDQDDYGFEDDEEFEELEEFEEFE